MKKIIMLVIAALAISSVSVFAQEKAGKKDTLKHTVLYSCPMHPGAKMDKPGKCPECGMDLVKSGKEKMKTEAAKNYKCPVHADVISDKAGKCSKCGKDLLKAPKEKMKEEVVKKFCCPMHADVTSDKAGKCSKCGMDLKPVEEKSGTGHH